MTDDGPGGSGKITATTDGVGAHEQEEVPWRYALVVEDSFPLRRMLCKILSTLRFQTLEANNGKEALGQLESAGPDSIDVILLDLMMPVMDGASFLAKARETYGDRLPQVLICSSRSDREAIQAVMGLDVAGYVLKPFKTETVINKLRQIFPDQSEQA